MKILRSYLQQWLPSIPQETKEIRDLFEDLGLEVKRVETSEWGPLFHLELLANRGDHHSYHGIAQELCGRLGGSVLPLPQTTLNQASAVRFQVTSPLCHAYTLTEIHIASNANTLASEWQSPLISSGSQLVNLAVDISNLVNLEYGQPTHAFDADCIQGNITVRESLPGEKAHLLFQPEPIVITEGTLVIADEEKILAIAGVIGCEASKATSETTRFLIESACFDPVAVRKAAKQLRLTTDASIRFERGSDVAMIQPAVERMVHLLKQHTPVSYCGAVEWLSLAPLPTTQIQLMVSHLNAFVGMDFSPQEVTEILRRYGFVMEAVQSSSDSLWVTVPPHRYWDVKDCEDLYEEVCRAYSYDRLPAQLPWDTLGAAQPPCEAMQSQVESVLLGQGFYEIFTDCFYSPQLRQNMWESDSHPLWPHVETLNALDKDCALLKNNCLAQALELVHQNTRRQQHDLKVFEWTKVFLPKAGKPVCEEIPVLWLVAMGNAVNHWQRQINIDVWFLKGIVETHAENLGLAFDYTKENSGHRLVEAFHPSQHLTLMHKGKPVGILGRIHPRLCQNFQISEFQPYYLEIETQALLQQPTDRPLVLPPLWQPIKRDLTFVLPPLVEAQQVQACIQRLEIETLDWIEIAQVYALEKLPNPSRAVTFSFQFSNEHQSSAAEINATCNTIIREVTQQLQEKGVHLRV